MAPVRFLFTLALFVCVGLAFILHPQSPLPKEWNPTVPFDVAHPISPLTTWKLRAIEGDRAQCLAALEETGAQFTPMPDLEESADCHIRNRVRLEALGGARLAPVETRCDTALRLAVWERQALQPLAAKYFGQSVREIKHLSSYNCRRIRTSSGDSQRWSTHATASGFDVSGVRLSDGQEYNLIDGWDAPRSGPFFRDAQKAACDVFGAVLGPDYNALHADHFHIQLSGVSCR